MEQKQKFSIPIAIVIAGIIVAGAIVFSNWKIPVPVKGGDTNTPTNGNEKQSVRPPDKNDHIIGNPDAVVVIVEYSDTECPFCKDFHQTMIAMMDKYGNSAKLAWVYRHLPIKELHPKAPKEAEAAECVAELGGETAFWKFINRIFEVTPSNNGLDETRLPVIAKEAGIAVEKSFSDCLASGKYASKINASVVEGFSAGALGTPHSFVFKNREYITSIQGAQPLSFVDSLIDTLLKSK